MMNLGFGTDVHAAGWFINDQNGTLPGEPFGQCNLLLVPAAESDDWGLERMSLNAQLFDVLLCQRPLLPETHKAGQAQSSKNCHGGVLTTVHGQHEPEALSVLRKKTNTGLQS